MPTENTTSIATGTATVSTTATLIVGGRSGRGGGLLVQNLSASDVFVGGSNVTTANGVRVAAGGSVSFDAFSGSVYGIVAAATADIRYAETY